MDTENGNVTSVIINSLLLTNSMTPYQEDLIGAANPLLTIMQVLSLAEVAINKKDVVYWAVSENLDKHRETREFDVHIQKMLLYLEKIGEFQAKEVSCGGNGFYRTLLENPHTNECLLIVHSWDYTALYMKKYLQMNADIRSPKFALIQYDLNKSRTELQNLKFVIPLENGTIYQSKDLMPLIGEVRKKFPLIPYSVSECIQSVKNRLNQTEENTRKEIDIEGDN